VITRGEATPKINHKAGYKRVGVGGEMNWEPYSKKGDVPEEKCTNFIKKVHKEGEIGSIGTGGGEVHKQKKTPKLKISPSKQSSSTSGSRRPPIQVKDPGKRGPDKDVQEGSVFPR